MTDGEHENSNKKISNNKIINPQHNVLISNDGAYHTTNILHGDIGCLGTANTALHTNAIFNQVNCQ